MIYKGIEIDSINFCEFLNCEFFTSYINLNHPIFDYLEILEDIYKRYKCLNIVDNASDNECSRISLEAEIIINHLLCKFPELLNLYKKISNSIDIFNEKSF